MTRRINTCAAGSLVVVLALCLTALYYSRSEVSPLPHYPEVARSFARRLPALHLSQKPFDGTISALAWTNYLSALDFDRSYFTQADLDELAPYRDSMGERLQDGCTEFAFKAFAVFQERVDERYTFVTNMLARGFDFSIEEYYRTRRRNEPWPLDRQAQDDLWRRRLKNEYLGRKLAREIEEPGEFDPPESDDQDDDLSLELEPGEFVGNRYAQFRTVIKDSDAEWVMQRYMSAFASAFDPHSAYMSPVALEDFNIDMQLSLVGIGALLRPEDGAAKVVSLIPGGPAERDRRDVALRPGDKIVGVGQDDGPVKNVMHLPLYRTVRKIRGEIGTRVVLRVIPASDPSGTTMKTVDLVRDEVKLEEQAASSEVVSLHDQAGHERKLGVIRLPAFYASMQTRDTEADGFRSATHDVSRALSEFNQAGVEGILLDLRNNSGGSLREAIEMTGLFIPGGPVVQVREARAVHLLSDLNPAVACRLPLVILVNRLSASASEILSAALQDYGRALVVGDSSTHGKGTVQTIIPLGEEDDGLGSVKVTTANYYRISGGSTQKRGVEPDIVIPSVLDSMELGESRLPNATPWSRISPAEYRELTELSVYVDKLREKSLLRRMDSPQFISYEKMVNHVRELHERRDVPLQWDARKQLVRAEQEVRRAESVISRDPEVNDDNGEDVVLDETLQILLDLVEKQGPELEFKRSGQDAKTDIIRRIFMR